MADDKNSHQRIEPKVSFILERSLSSLEQASSYYTNVVDYTSKVKQHQAGIDL